MTHPTVAPILTARGLMKRYGTVVAMNGADFSSRQGVISPDFSENLRAIGELSGVGFAAVDAVMLKLLTD